MAWDRLRALSVGQATRCEEATKPRCECRCGGKLHGARRTLNVRELPDGDPHKPAKEEEGTPETTAELNQLLLF